MTLSVYRLGLSFLLLTIPTETSQRSCNGGRIHKSGKGCDERLDEFLHDVLQAREDLMWIDQVAYQMHSSKVVHDSPRLQEKLNAMFFNSEQRVWAPEKNANTAIRKRYKRHSKQTVKSPPKHNANPAAYGENVLANKKNSDSPKREYEAGSLRQQNFNSTMVQKIRTKNGIATTTAAAVDPLEKILQSINVFPVEDDREDARPGGGEFNDDAAENDFQSGLLEHETAGAFAAAASNNKSFGEKHSRVRRSLKSSEADMFGNNIIELPKSENDADTAQNKKAMNGDLAREIVDAIFNKMKLQGGFNVPISVSPYYTRPENAMFVKNFNGEKPNLVATSGPQIFQNKVMTMVQQLISEEVDKKSCATLQPELHHFLEWLIDSHIDNGENVNSLRENTNNIVGNKQSNNNPIVNLEEWYQKAESLKNLLNEYDKLSKKEKSKVEAIYEYLVSRFEFAEAYIKAFESHELPVDQLSKIHIK